MFRTGFVVSLLAVIFMAPSLINGGPLYYFDSAAYIESVAKAADRLLAAGGAEAAGQEIPPARTFGTAEGDGVVISGRSIYYGVLAYLGWAGTIWLPVVVQCVALAWLLVAHVRRLAGSMWARISVLTAIVLSLGTPAAFFAGLVMPDIWAGLSILALALLWSPKSDLGRGEILAILVILAFSTLAHGSHLLLVAALLLGYAISRRSTASAVQLRSAMFAIPAVAVIAGIAGQAAFSIAVHWAYGQPPLSRPLLTAHLVDLGPGTTLAQDTCPESGFALCAFEDRLPTDWISFLFSTSETTGVFAAADAETKRELSSEQLSFALATLAAEPLATAGGMAFDGLKQLWTLSVDDVPMTRDTTSFLERSYPPDLVALIESTLIYDHPGWATIVTWLAQVGTAASSVVLLFWAWLRFGQGTTDPQRRIDVIVAVCVAGVVANALICGVLASPYGRFQARVTWVLPLLLLFILAAREWRPMHAKRFSTGR